MKNILSFKPGTPILGSEIKKWFMYHSTNQTSHSKSAIYMKNHFEGLRDEKYYFIVPHVHNGYPRETSYFKPDVVNLSSLKRFI